MPHFFKKYKTIILSLLFLLAVTLSCTFFNLNDGFVSDDWDMIYATSHYNTNPLHYFVSNRYGIQGQGDVFRPLFVLSFWLDGKVWGLLNAKGYHVTNFALYLFSVWLIYLAVLKVVSKRHPGRAAQWVALLTASLFGVSPMHTESATWISGRTDVIAFFFTVASLYCFTLFEVVTSRSKKVAAYAGSLLLFFLALLSKEMALAYPAVIIAYVFIFKEGTWRGRIWYTAKTCILFVVVWVLYLALRKYSIGVFTGGYGGVRYFTSVAYSLRTVTLNTGYQLVFWMGKIRDNALLLFRAYPIGFFVFLFALAAGFYYQFKSYRKELLFAFALMGIFLTPVINQPVDVYTHGAQRLVYFSSFGFYFVCAIILYYLLSAKPRILLFVSGLLIIASAAMTIKLNLNWQLASQEQAQLITQMGNFTSLDNDNADRHQGIMILNLPDNIEGAYVARNSLREALLLLYPSYHFDMIILPFGLSLTTQNFDHDLMEWKQTRPNFLVGSKRVGQHNLIMGLENFHSDEVATKILNYDHEFDVGDRIWIELQDKFLQENKNKELYYLYYNNGRFEELTVTP